MTSVLLTTMLEMLKTSFDIRFEQVLVKIFNSGLAYLFSIIKGKTVPVLQIL